MSEALNRHLECDIPALQAILPDLVLAKMGDRQADLEAAIQVVSLCLANMRDIEQAVG